jgi:arylsulfatase A-like enzyme
MTYPGLPGLNRGEHAMTEELPVAEETTPEPTVEETTEQVETQQEEAAPSEEKPSGFQKRINELTREKYEARRQAEALQEQLNQFQAQQAQTQQFSTDPPTLEECGYDEVQHKNAVRQWADSQFENYQNTLTQQAQQQQAMLEQQQAQVALQRKVAEAEEKYPGFTARVNSPELPPLQVINQAAYEAVVNSDNFADVANYLASNPAEVYAFQNLTPVQAVREITKLEIKLSSKPSPSTEQVPTPSEVGGTAESVKDRSKMSTADWMKWRNDSLQR